MRCLKPLELPILFGFSILAMKCGYHQVEIEKEHKERTAFSVGPLGFFEFNLMPFGLSNRPATYQCLMNDCFEDLHLRACLIYIDDIIVFADRTPSSTYPGFPVGASLWNETSSKQVLPFSRTGLSSLAISSQMMG